MTLAAFADQLWPLTRDLEALYGDWLPRLRAAFGELRRPQLRDPLGDPDGYGGIARRGGWDRLLISEWALADAVPDEFIRRAAMREQLFLELSRVVPVADQVTRVWLDCGPDQLGVNRLAHLAILIVLRRRADEAGGTLLWSTLHEPGVFHDDVDPEQVLAQRTTRRCLPTLIGDGERLVIGPAVRDARQIEVTEIPTGLQVCFDGARVDLAVPSLADAARMLSRPVQPAGPALVKRTVHGPIQALRFNPGGGALLVRDGERVLAFAVPTSVRPRSKLRDMDAFEGGRLVAVSWKRQRLCTLRQVEHEATLHLGSGIFRMPWPADFEPAPGLPWMLVLPQSYLSPDSARPRLAVLVPDAHGMLYTFDFLKGAVVPVDRADSELNAHDSVLLWARARNLVRLIPALSPRLQSAVLADYGEAELPLTGPVADRISSIQDGVLLQAVLSDRSWYLTALLGYGRISTAAPRIECDDPVIGVFREGRDNQRLGLFTRRGDEIEQRRPWMAPVVVARVDGLDHVATGGREVPLVATSDHDGFVKVTSIPGQMLLQFDPRRDW